MPEIKASYREDRLIYMTGSLVAAAAQAATRSSVMDGFTMTIAEGYCYGNMGRYCPADLKKAGFDGAVSDCFTYLLQSPDCDMPV